MGNSSEKKTEKKKIGESEKTEKLKSGTNKTRKNSKSELWRKNSLLKSDHIMITSIDYVNSYKIDKTYKLSCILTYSK